MLTKALKWTNKYFTQLKFSNLNKKGKQTDNADARNSVWHHARHWNANIEHCDGAYTYSDDHRRITHQQKISETLVFCSFDSLIVHLLLLAQFSFSVHTKKITNHMHKLLDPWCWMLCHMFSATSCMLDISYPGSSRAKDSLLHGN